ncbi:MarR family winged helix-turn-helix transcriptional regulator [Paenibacillus sp. S150]|uniref:MarR family winged helix-turn-helix transcriptional regulator n=1 Tax=Paenibacillus sp. S150 TaxID=2749826 RepID=UPI001C59A8C5|nr:MarR family transcriptional regulator [Paenibacillus sp. S150]MBW4082984.1 MarR family transcriptional regulator [Paenibacillus sp. S150]
MLNLKKEPIGKLISQLHRQNQKFLAKEMLPYGIGSGGQHSFLKLILNQPGITQDQMTNEMKFDKATTARSVKQLEESGYIERKTDPSDRRSSLLYPTPKALEFAPVLQSVLAELNRKLTVGLTAEEADQLVNLLQKINRNSAKL